MNSALRRSAVCRVPTAMRPPAIMNDQPLPRLNNTQPRIGLANIQPASTPARLLPDHRHQKANTTQRRQMHQKAKPTKKPLSQAPPTPAAEP